MRKNYTLFLLLILTGYISKGQGIPPGYYNAANGLNCQNLKSALSNIIANGQITLVYGQLDDIQMPVADTIRTDDGTGFIVWDIYSNNNAGPEPFTFSMTQSAAGGFCGSTTPAVEGVCWNKEHTFPRAWFRNMDGTYPSPTQADMFNVRPTDSKINSRRANYPYSTVGAATYQFPTVGMYPGYPIPPNPVLDKLGPSNATGVTVPIAFEPANAVKGDIARGYFYMMTRYENDINTWITTNPVAGIAYVIDAANTTYPSFNLPYLKMLYDWHVADPVDAREIKRNDLVYSQQNNRNPYIDHPEYVYQVWQCTGVIPVTIMDFTASKNNASVILKWQATNETNFKRYEVERSTDGNNFYKIGEITGTNLSNYSFIDNNLPARSIAYYRLKIVDIDERFRNSKIIAVRLNNNFSNALVYPNPTGGMLTIKLTEALVSNSVLELTDITGRKLKQLNISKGQLSIDIHVDELPAGRYFFKIYNDTQLINQSFVKIN